MKKRTIVYNGFISERPYGEGDALYIGEYARPIAQIFAEDFALKKVSIRYWTADKKISKNKLKELHLLKVLGYVDADCHNAYSEMTGYLWTTQEIKVGGHDLMNEIWGNIDKYIYLEVDIHE